MKGLNSDFNETLYTYRLHKEMNLENISCGLKGIVKLPLICISVIRILAFFVIS